MNSTRPSPIDRRTLLATGASALLISALCHRTAWAQGRPALLDTWAREVVDLKVNLQAGSIGVTQWQEAIEQLNQSVPVADLTAYLDIDALTRDFQYASSLAEARDPVLPREIMGAAGMRGWFIRVFGLRQGGAVVPHIHNNMVSAHLVISGGFRARTHNRVRDLPDAVLLRPTRDSVIAPGDVISMSDQRDNQHWLVARQDRSMTLDVGVVGVPASWEYGLEANRYNMIFVDPTVGAQRDDTVVAPILTFEQASAKFAA